MIYPRPHPAEFAIDAPDSEIRPFNAWARGLGIAFDETNGFPEMESFNGLLQAITQYIKYLEQNGLSEWSNDVEYPHGAGCRVGQIWYRAKNQNTNKPPATSQNDWEVFFNANELSYGDPILREGNTISIKDASTTQKGVARFATNAEVANKQNVSAAITPKNVVDMFVSDNNSETLPSGRVFKWGDATRTGNVTYINFPSPFANNCLNVQLTQTTKSSASNANIRLLSKSRTGFSVETLENETGFTWFAIGY